MLYNSYNICSIFWLLLLCLSISAKQKISNKITNYYREGDGITILSDESVKKTFYNQNHSWIIQYYKRNCEYCKDFAATFKYIAKDMESWHQFLEFGVIDCIKYPKVLMCKNLNKIDQPVIVYYHEYFFYKDDDEETIPMDYDARELKQAIIQHIIVEQNMGRGKIFPNIRPYTSYNINRLFSGFSTPVNLTNDVIALLFEYEKNSVGPQLIMDFYHIPRVKIKYCYSTNKKLRDMMKIKKIPTLVIIKKNRTFQRFYTNIETKTKIKKIINSFLQIKLITTEKKFPRSINRTKLKKRKLNVNVKVQKHPNKFTTSIIQQYLASYKKQIMKNKIKDMHDPLFLIDLETALRKSFKNEIASHMLITGEKYHALVNYTNVIMKYFPLSKRGNKFMIDFRKRVIMNKDEMHGIKIKTLFQKHSNMFSTKEEWMACDRNDNKYGKFTCGIWKMFHYLTVRAAEIDKARNINDILEVLIAFKGYVRYFMTCEDCVQLILIILEEQDINNVTSFDSAILWLWMIHNIVNDKLAQDDIRSQLNYKNKYSITKHIEYPKIQFPAPDKCPICRNIDNTWNMDAVLYYIKKVYSNYTSTSQRFHLNIQKRMGDITVREILNSSAVIVLYLFAAILLVIIAKLFMKFCYKMFSIRTSNINQ